MPITIAGSGTITGISAGGLPDDSIIAADIAAGAVTTAKVADANITAAKLDGAQSGSAPIYGARAWVNFDGTSNSANLTGTYSQSGTTVTVTVADHGLIAGNVVYADATSGTAVDGTYTVATVISSSQFTYTAGTSLTTSGNMTLRRNTIRASGNVSSITDNGVGDYTVNFTTAMPDANYSIVGTSVNVDSLINPVVYSTSTGAAAATMTTSAVRIATRTNTTNYDVSGVFIAIFR